jgi:hypothetical protein
LFFGFGFRWQYAAAESLWLDGFRVAFAPILDSIGQPNYVTWDELREIQNMGHEIWLRGGSASHTVGGPTRWATYTTAQLDTALSNAKVIFANQGIALRGFQWPEGDSASFAKFRTTIAKHFDCGIFNMGWNPARPYGAGVGLTDSVSVWNLGDILANYSTDWLVCAESVIAFYAGENDWVLLQIIASPVVGNAAIQMGPDPRLLWQWADSSGIQILPPAEVAKQWYSLGWPTDWNPISNGDFTQDLDADGRPDGWYCVDSLGGDCSRISPSLIMKNASICPTPAGHKNCAMILPYGTTTLRGLFYGFQKNTNYAFSFWARKKNTSEPTSNVRLDIYRRGGSEQSIGSDAGARWGPYIEPTMPNDTLWHKIDYTVDPNLIMPVCEEMALAYIGVRSYSGNDTCYVTGFEAHLWNEDVQNGVDRGLIPVGTNLFFSADYDSVYAITPTGVKKAAALQ